MLVYNDLIAFYNYIETPNSAKILKMSDLLALSNADSKSIKHKYKSRYWRFTYLSTKHLIINAGYNVLRYARNPN